MSLFNQFWLKAVFSKNVFCHSDPLYRAISCGSLVSPHDWLEPLFSARLCFYKVEVPWCSGLATVGVTEAAAYASVCI